LLFSTVKKSKKAEPVMKVRHERRYIRLLLHSNLRSLIEH